ncbi:gephyrin-like molybdotransferase Glp [Orrella sp. JC864]|uniref:molybdopterin-binding protein n=1 Tax=Orrella sp. JC864 TaxID=3120298 RepID=UPI0012BB5034
MLDFDSAQKKLAEAGPAPAAPQTVALMQANGRVLARAATAVLDAPPADNSAMDGYALRAADYAEGRGLPVHQRVYAGEAPQPLPPGQAARLFTGSLMPPGADTVVMQEDCTETDGEVFIARPPRPGQHVRRRGEDIARGATLLPAGTVLGPAQIAALASQGMATLAVYPRVRVGILTTGDELVAAGQPRAEQQIFNSNGPMLAALAEDMGAVPQRVLHAPDDAASLRRAFEQLLAECDLVLSVGGVSVGERDLVKPTLAALGGQLDLWKVRMKPGKPVALAHVGGKPVVGLPGNPVSAFAVFALMVTPMLRRMQGRAEPFPAVERGVLLAGKPYRGDREEFLRVRSSVNEQGVRALTPYPQQGSGVISSLPWAHGLARLPADTTVEAGDLVRYYDLKHWLR